MNNSFVNLNLFYFPLNTIIVDDDTDFLKIIASNLTDIPVSTYNSTNEILTKINPIDISVKNFIEDNFAGISDLNYENIKDFVENCKEVHGIIISDYDMSKISNINGIELLSTMCDTDLIKILLTSVYTIEDAVNALNKGIIDYYLPKDRIHIISHVINELHTKFFYNITKNVMKIIHKNRLKFFNDKDYLKIFNSICNQYKVNKYFILNSYGGYYLENSKEKFIFTIFHKDDLNDISNELIPSKKNDVKNGKLIPSYFSDNFGEYTLIRAKKEGDYYYSVENFKI
jgi:ActR/RegA family two-component response regulator